MVWMGWLVAAIAVCIAVWLYLQLRKERATTRHLDDELVDALGEVDTLRAIQAQLVPASEEALLGRLASGFVTDVQAPLAEAVARVGVVGTSLDDYRALVKAYDNAVQYCLQPVEMIFGADKAGLDQLVEDARRKLFTARAALDKSNLLVDACQRLDEVERALVGSDALASALRMAVQAPAAGNATGSDPVAALDAALTLASRVWAGRIEIVRDYADLPRVSLPVDQLTRAFIQLANNAAAAMDGEGRLVVQARANPSRGVEISFTDSGSGIDEDVLPSIFEPYFTTRPGAAGLGLASVRNLVKAHGGSVTVRTKPGEGSTFTLVLPVDSTPVN